jgi:arylsulfate sulfotransferase
MNHRNRTLLSPPHQFVQKSSVRGRSPRGYRALWGFATAAVAMLLLAETGTAANKIVTVRSHAAGKTPFIEMVKVHMDDTSMLQYVTFTITPKSGSLTRPISARYSTSYLSGKGYVDGGTGVITVPVFGLYQDYANTATLTFGFFNGTSETDTLGIVSAHYNSGTYDKPMEVLTPRTTEPMSYDFIEMKTDLNKHSPTIIDTDGEVRWVGTTADASLTVIFYGNSYYSVDYLPGAINTKTGMGPPGTKVLRNDFDGSVSTVADYAAAGVTTFHHNFDFGKAGILTCISTADYTYSNVMEIDTAGNVLHQWNLADIISKAMIAGGDDPSRFVPAAGALTDWFHNNANTYRSSDNSLIVSSRENFVIALDYDTGAIKWILGDPTKEWHEFASLRKYELKGSAGTHDPIGQHAVSFFQDKLLLFDDGYGSTVQKPAGKTRSYSAPRKYTINEAAGTATEIWNYLADPAIDSPITSSVYEDAPGSYLIDYAVGGPFMFTELFGLLPSGAKAFEYKYSLIGNLTCWNAVPIHLENLVFN